MKYTKFFLTIALCVSGIIGSVAANPDSDAIIKAASYNIRQMNDHDTKNGNGWSRRLPNLAGLIRFHDFEIFGTQEGFKNQLEDLKGMLPGFEYTGIGREDGKDAGEHSAIFYRTDLFELLDHGDFWLSEHPEQPGLGWDAVCPRICSWGKFVHKPSGRVFTFFNLHMDHVGKKARVESAKLVRQRISEIAGDEPAIVTGDFNVDQTHESYNTMTEGGRLNDSYSIADIRYAPNGTFNGYYTDGFTSSRIDHVFVTPGIEVLRYGVLTDTYRTKDRKEERIELSDAPGEIDAVRYNARVPSDHFPVVTEIVLPETPGFTTLADIFDNLEKLETLTPISVKELAKTGNISGVKKGRGLIWGNAEPRAAILEQLSKIPSDLVYYDVTTDRFNISRLYYQEGIEKGKGDALLVVVGHGGNDTVVLLAENVARKDLDKMFHIRR